jgi:hypothetical protein
MFEKHLVECQCSLSIFANNNKTVYHKIPVLSFYEEDKETIKEKYIICDNCGIVHRVYEVFKSEIKWGMENLKNLVNTIDDIEQNLNFLDLEKLTTLLRQENVLTHDWEFVEYLIENDLEGSIVLQKTESDNNIVCKILEIKGKKFRTKKETYQRYL